MLRRVALGFTLGIAAILVLGPGLFAQDETPTKVNVQNRAGDLPFSTSVGTEVEHVDLASGDLVVHIPIAHVTKGAVWTLILG